ncbi:hypothetical protein A1Q2_03213 [Trichosporon asahii var. asahii CBS 8904]|uniref:Uncharacterized protein n=3 Tax=Dikarya TaxID=451864 RepID=K1W061_TRIAC|nr:hypothetical protein A1Q1_06731 [Trichosporon asahii var. asahii CBS 2479]EJT52018.1 hypothetical protein A1Q1_06731 [Trichosporon asahii var. asahii CBS 2479]EKD02453.1 hypothetical protein A1Q2_03213 [Trichosporon asahii var. asahii CBS 8904]
MSSPEELELDMCPKGSSEKDLAESKGSRRRRDAAGQPKTGVEEDEDEVADNCGQVCAGRNHRLTGSGGSGGGKSTSLLELLDLKTAEGRCLGDISEDERSMLELLEPQLAGMVVA